MAAPIWPGWWSTTWGTPPEVEADLRQEMDGIVGEGIQCCVLGCTHYPLVADSIRRLYPGLPLIDPAEEMARALKERLEGEGLLAPGGRPGGLTIYTTGGVEEYALRARQVGLERIGGVSFYPPMAL